MSGASIAAEVATALGEVAGEVGDGSFTVTLVRAPVEDPDNPTNPWDEPPQAPGPVDLPAIVTMFPQRLIDGTLIQAFDRKVMIAAQGTKPSTADTLMIGGETYRIINVEETAPSGVALFFTVQARK